LVKATFTAVPLAGYFYAPSSNVTCRVNEHHRNQEAGGLSPSFRPKSDSNIAQLALLEGHIANQISQYGKRMAVLPLDHLHLKVHLTSMGPLQPF